MSESEIIFKNDDCIVAVSPIISEYQLNDVIGRLQLPALNAKSIKRQCEWATTHLLLEFIFGRYVSYKYDADGKPLLIHRTENISISHCKNYCAVIIHKTKPVGIDIEESSDRIFRIADRFLTKDENSWIDESENKTDILYLIWCAKEALYKVCECKPDFKENLFVEKSTLNEAGQLHARLEMNDQKDLFLLSYIKSEKYILVYTL